MAKSRREQEREDRLKKLEESISLLDEKVMPLLSKMKESLRLNGINLYISKAYDLKNLERSKPLILLQLHSLDLRYKNGDIIESDEVNLRVLDEKTGEFVAEWFDLPKSKIFYGTAEHCLDQVVEFLLKNFYYKVEFARRSGR